MVDLHKVGLQVDSSGLVKGERALGKFAVAGGKAQDEVNRLKNAIQSSRSAVDVYERAVAKTRQQISDAAKQWAVASRAAAESGDSTSRAAAKAEQARSRIAGLRETLERQNVALKNAEIAFRGNVTAHGAALRAARQTTTAMQGVAAAATSQAAAVKTAGAQSAGFGQQMHSASGHTANLAAQFNDIGVQLAAGQSPLLLAVQQGTQINQVLATMGQGGGAVRALGAAFATMVSPMSLATIGIIAGGAALGQWGLKAISARNETRSLAELTDSLRDSVDEYRSAADEVLLTVDEQADAYGSLADEMREVQRIQAQLAQVAAQEALDKVTASLGRATDGGILANPVLQDFLNIITGRTQVQRFFDIPAEEVSRVEHMVRSFENINKALGESKGNAEEQNKQLRALLVVATSLAKEYDGINKTEREFLQHLADAAEQSATMVVALEEMTVQGVKRVEVSKSTANWVERTLRYLTAQKAEAATIARHGAQSVEVQEQQAQAARAALEADIERRGVSGDMAERLRDALAAQQEAKAAAEDRVEADREALRVAEQQEQVAKRQAAIDAQRAHAEEAIAQRLQNRIEVARAIVVHGRDSVQAKLAEEAVSRRLFELDLERQGITGEIRSNLVAQYEAAAQLERQIVQAQPAFQGVNSTIQSIADAWGKFVVDGFRDFKGFARSVLDTFKRMLAQMIATAARNRIMLNMGIGGAGGAPMGGGGGGLFGGLLGGGGGGGGSLFSGIGKLFGGGGQGGGGFLSNLFGGGAAAAAAPNVVAGLAGGGAAAMGSLAGTSTAFGFGSAAGIGAGGLGAGAGLGTLTAPTLAGGGGAAAAGAGLLGPVGLAVAGGALVFAALQTKTKVIDAGLKVSIDAAGTLVENFEEIEKSRFFGLSKKRSERTLAADPREVAAVTNAVTAYRESIEAYADILKLGTDVTRDFTHEFQISVKAGDDITEALGKIRNEMAKFAAEGSGLELSLENAGDELRTYALTLTSVNRALRAAGQEAFAMGVPGAQSASDLAGRFGGADQFQRSTAEFYQAFVPEAERMENLKASLAGTLATLNTALPDSLESFRQIVESQDLMTESGRELYSSLLQIAPQFADLIGYETQLAEERRQAADAARQAAAAEQQRAAAERQRAAAEAARELERAAAERRRQQEIAAAEEARKREEARLELQRLEAEFYQTFVPEAERMADLRTTITDTLGELNVAIPQSMNGFRELVAALDVSTQAGAELYVTLLQLAPQFAQLAAYEQRLADERMARARQEIATRTDFESRIQGMVHQLTDTPLQAAARQRDALLAEALTIGANTEGVIEWYELTAQNIRDEEAARRRAEAEAAQAEADRMAEQRRAEQERIVRAREAATVRARELFVPEAQLIAEIRRTLMDAGVALNADQYIAQLEALRAADVARYDELLAYAPQLSRLLQFEQRVASEREAAAQRQAEEERRRREQEQQRFRQQFDNFYNTFYSREERVADTRRELTASFGALGLALPRTRQAFRDLIEDTNPSSGLYRSLVGLAEQFAFITDETNRLNDTLGASQRVFRDLREEAFVQSARGGVGTDGAAIGSTAAENNRLLRAILRAIREGDFNNVRELRDLLDETRGLEYEPSTQTLDLS